MKLLLVGGENDYTMYQFVRDLKITNPHYQIDYLSLVPKKQTIQSQQLYQEFEQTIFLKHYSKRDLILKKGHILLKFFFMVNYWLVKVPILFSKKGFIEIKEHFIDELRIYLNYHNNLKKRIRTYDIINVQTLKKEHALLLPYLQLHTNNLLLSFWGSDLLRYSSKNSSYYLSQRFALNLVDAISIQTQELKEIICTKYNQYLRNKINVLFFGLPKSRFELINKAKENYDKSQISTNRIIIRIGYTGQEEQQHFSIIDALFKVKPNIKNKFFLYLPMTYGGDEVYINTVAQELRRKFKGQYQIFKEFLPDHEYMKIVAESDIFINCRTTDAFNGAMIESLYAGNVVINGAWLPYKKLTIDDYYHFIVESISELTNKIPILINNIQKEQKKCEQNEKIINLLCNEHVIPQWSDWYRANLKKDKF
ncbi:MAG: hypothetical protein ACI85O_001831 [Saprospiraceae bacterium]|jgi:hypothetical protein